MRYYVSKNHNTLNRKPFQPEKITPYICLNPYYSTSLSVPANVLLDSGAFQDVKTQHRLSFSSALQRQLDYEKGHNFTSECVVSYDRIVDEKYDKTMGQVKQRVDLRTATKYVRETIAAAKYLADQRSDMKSRKLILSCQGVTKRQYLYCLKEVLEFVEPEDIIGFGGFCIVGQKPQLITDFLRTVELALPKIKEKGVKRIHLFGVGVLRPLVRVYFLARKYGIDVSYDTSSYEFNSTMGKMFNPEILGMSKIFTKEEKFEMYHPCDLALFNIKLINLFWDQVVEFADPLGRNDLYK